MVKVKVIGQEMVAGVRKWSLEMVNFLGEDPQTPRNKQRSQARSDWLRQGRRAIPRKKNGKDAQTLSLSNAVNRIRIGRPGTEIFNETCKNNDKLNVNTLTVKLASFQTDHIVNRGQRERSPPLPEIMLPSCPHLGQSQVSAQPECNGKASTWGILLRDQGFP